MICQWYLVGVTVPVVEEELIIGTDGSSRGNPGPSGWGWIASATQWECGSLPVATSIVAELTAVWRTLSAIPPTQPVLILTDSQFVVNVITRWAKGWERNNWVKKDGTPVSNQQLVQALWEQVKDRPSAVRVQWVRGHNGHPMNEAADALATRGSREAQRTKQRRVIGPGWVPGEATTGSA